MLWTTKHHYHSWPFDKEAELEAVIGEVKATLFGESRIYQAPRYTSLARLDKAKNLDEAF